LARHAFLVTETFVSLKCFPEGKEDGEGPRLFGGGGGGGGDPNKFERGGGGGGPKLFVLLVGGGPT